MNNLSTEVNQDGTETILNIVIKSLRAIYPAWRTTIKSQIELDNMKKEWLKAFIENRINSDDKINRGLAQARQDIQPFLPSVGQFIKWCKKPHASYSNCKLLETGEPVTIERVKEMQNMTQDELKKLARERQ